MAAGETASPPSFSPNLLPFVILSPNPPAAFEPDPSSTRPPADRPDGGGRDSIRAAPVAGARKFREETCITTALKMKWRRLLI
uniref:Uncharacterized protein n=1 Tax=Leersia perrieri TaxID=77586 RepID=A0A0D9X1G4_9ORYZ